MCRTANKLSGKRIGYPYPRRAHSVGVRPYFASAPFAACRFVEIDNFGGQMSDANSGLRVPILTVPLEEATVTQGVLRIAGPLGVKFPPRLPFDSTIQVAMAI